MFSKKIILSACLIICASCSNNDNPIIAPSAIGNDAANAQAQNSLVIDPGSATLTVGQSVVLNATLTQNGKTNADVPTNWVSLDPNVAIVDATGKITGLKPGTTRVKAETLGQQALVLVTVSAAGEVNTPSTTPSADTETSDSSLQNEDSESSPELAKLRTIVIRPENEAVQPTIFKFSRLGEQRQFVAVGKDSEGQDIKNLTFSWSSSDEAIATVNTTGVVQAESTGVTNLIASAGGVTSNIIQVEVQEGTIRAHIKFTE